MESKQNDRLIEILFPVSCAAYFLRFPILKSKLCLWDFLTVNDNIIFRLWFFLS